MQISETGKKKSEFLLRLFKLIHWFLSIMIFLLFWFVFRYSTIFGNFDETRRYDVYITILFTLLFSWFNSVFHSYDLGYSRIRHLALSQCLSDFFGILLIYCAVSLAWLQFLDPFCFLAALLTMTILNLLWSSYANKLFYRVTERIHMVVLYRNEDDLARFRIIAGKPLEMTVKIEKYVRYDGDDLSEILPELDGFDGVFAIGIHDAVMNSLSKYCLTNGVKGFFVPHIGNVIISGARHIKSFTSPVVLVSRADKSFEYLFIKRAFDIFASSVGIILLSPLMLITALLIKAYDAGPAIYKQVRLTKDAKKFYIYKFRSMRVDAEKEGKAILSTGEKDDRITPVGRFIRACRLDELPQLFNILKGDMSLVGPRPERPEIAAEYEKALPEFALRLQVKAGLTGYAQVYGKYNTSPYEKLEFDLMYINTMSILTDIELMFDTVRILFKKDSTEGVAVGQETAMSP